MENKECSACHQSLPVDRFYQKDGRPNDSRCKDCVCAAHKEERALKPKKTHKICTMCGENLPRSEEFYSPIWKHGKFIGWQGKCKPCMVKYVQQRMAESPEYFESRRLSNLASAKRLRQEQSEKFRAKDRAFDLKRKYGVTVEWYDATLHAQGGVCAICRRPQGKHRLAVDHDHKDGQVRGLLCDRCNPLLERVESTPDWMESALAYLTKFEIAKREEELAGGKVSTITQPITYPDGKSQCCGAPIVEHDDMCCTACGNPCSPQQTVRVGISSDKPVIAKPMFGK